jgi:hypothetical protein
MPASLRSRISRRILARVVSPLLAHMAARKLAVSASNSGKNGHYAPIRWSNQS